VGQEQQQPAGGHLGRGQHASGNHIATIFYGAHVATGAYSETINHYSVLRTLEALYGLPFAGKSSTATTISDIWN